MRKELNDKLLADFPRLFHGMTLTPQQSCLGGWGCGGGDGWFNIVYELSGLLEEEFQSLPKEEQDDDYVVAQVKQKFCGLRFYMEKATDEMRNIIDIYEAMSNGICEDCGKKREGKYEGMGAGRANCESCATVKRSDLRARAK